VVQRSRPERSNAALAMLHPAPLPGGEKFQQEQREAIKKTPGSFQEVS